MLQDKYTCLLSKLPRVPNGIHDLGVCLLRAFQVCLSPFTVGMHPFVGWSARELLNVHKCTSTVRHAKGLSQHNDNAPLRLLPLQEWQQGSAVSDLDEGHAQIWAIKRRLQQVVQSFKAT